MDANSYALKVQPADKSLGLVIRKAVWLGKAKPNEVDGGKPAQPSGTPGADPCHPLLLQPPHPFFSRCVIEAGKCAGSRIHADTNPTPVSAAAPEPVIEPHARPHTGT